MGSSKLKLSAAVLGAIFAFSATHAKAIPANPLPIGPTTKLAAIPANPLPIGPTTKLAAIPANPLPIGPTTKLVG